jgi:hypothetical protein
MAIEIRLIRVNIERKLRSSPLLRLSASEAVRNWTNTTGAQPQNLDNPGGDAATSFAIIVNSGRPF